MLSAQFCDHVTSHRFVGPTGHVLPHALTHFGYMRNIDQNINMFGLMGY